MQQPQQQQQQPFPGQPMQRPPFPPGNQPMRPINFRPGQPPVPQQTPSPQGQFRPQPPMQPIRPGFQPGASPQPHHPGLPQGQVRPGFIPQQQPGAPGQRPPQFMRPPVHQSPIQSPANLVRPLGTPSPVQQHQPLPTTPLSPTSQNTSVQAADHHRRKRMYPEQITKAYSGDSVPLASPTYPQQQQQGGYAISPGMANQQLNQQPQFISPMGTPSAGYAQPQQQQPQQQGYAQPQQPSGYNAYNQDSVGQMSSQFSNMSMGGSAAPVSNYETIV